MEIRVNDQLYEECIQALRKLIQIPSLKAEATEHHPFGEPVGQALDFFLKQAEKLGFQARSLDGYMGIVEMGEGEEELGILVHLDVVPAGDRSKWRFDPFSAEIHDGALWGRGTLDDKGPAMAVLYAMKLLLDLGLAWQRRVRLIIGTDEESTWQDIEYYKQQEKPPTLAFTPDGCFPVTNSEKGILTLSYHKQLEKPSVVTEIQAGERFNVTPGLAQAILYLKDSKLEGEALQSTAHVTAHQLAEETWQIVARGEDGRTSDPCVEQNAIHLLIQYLKGFLPEGDGFWEAVHFYEEYLQKADGSGHDCQLQDDISGELTLAPCILEWKDSRVSFVSNIRYPSTFKLEPILERVTSRLQHSSYFWEVLDHKEAIFIPEDDPFIQKLMSVYNEYFQRQDEPLSISGGTYARAFPNTVAFGALLPGKPLNAHEPNEHVELDVIQDWINVYAQAIYTLAASGDR